VNEVFLAKIGVIIQGPLITYGQGPNNSPDGFDTTETILANCYKIKCLEFNYIVSTWVQMKERERCINSDLMQNDISVLASNIPDIFDPDHRYKQRYGTLVGMDVLEQEHQCSFYVKIRTDMLMPDAFWDWIKDISSQNNNKLGISELYHSNPFYMGDFIYAGNRVVFRNMLDAFMRYESEIFHPLIAIDDGIKYCQCLNFFNFDRYSFRKVYVAFVFVFKKNYLNFLWNYFVTESIATVPKNVWCDIEWRGRKISDFINIHAFSFRQYSSHPDDMSILRNVVTFLEGYSSYWVKCKKHRLITIAIPLACKIMRRLKLC